MVSTLSIIFMIITFLICTGVPIAIAIIFIKKKISTLKVFLIGMLGFFASQLIIRIPLLSILSSQSWYVDFASNILGISIFLGLTAAIFETFGRLLVFKVLLKKNHLYGDGIMAGLGHGAIEAIALVGLAYINNIVFSIMINTGAIQTLMDSLASNPVAMASTKQGIDTLINTPASIFLVSGFERIFTIIVHITLSLIVLEGIKRKKQHYLWSMLY